MTVGTELPSACAKAGSVTYRVPDVDHLSMQILHEYR